MHTLEQLRRGDLAGATRLDLSCGLDELPAEVLGLADSLEVLNLSGNRLTTLPVWLPRLQRLKVVFASDNPFTTLPEVLGDCPALEMVGFKACRIARVPSASLPPALRWLILTDNAIDTLPDAVGERPRLQKLMLAGNRLQVLPEGLAGAERLELLRISANRFQRLPDWLLRLPRLSWLALAGNPLGWAVPPLELPVVDWGDIRPGEALGEGASGRAVRATVTGWPGELALKLFKGAVTSDGLPEHEMAAGGAAGAHPALCTPVARLQGHPDGAQGMLLPLIPPGHVLLAGPPSRPAARATSTPTAGSWPPGRRCACCAASATRWPTCTRMAWYTATSMPTTSCGTRPPATRCSATSAPPPCCRPTSRRWPARCRRWRCAPSVACWRNWGIAWMSHRTIGCVP
jgi:hypothetical protein